MPQLHNLMDNKGDTSKTLKVAKVHNVFYYELAL